MSRTEEEIELLPVWDVPKTRACLLCRRDFESAWSGERICKQCKGTAAWKSGG